MLPRLVWKRTGKPLSTKTLHFEDCIPPPARPHFTSASVTPHSPDPLHLYRKAQREASTLKGKRRSISPQSTTLPVTKAVEQRTLKVLPRYDERNRKVLGPLVSRPKKKEPLHKPSPPVSRSEVYIDQLISARKSIDFSAIPRPTEATPVKVNMKELLLDEEAGWGGDKGESMLSAVRAGDSLVVDARVSSSFLSPTRRWRCREAEAVERKRSKPSVSPQCLTPELKLKKQITDFEMRIQRVMDSCTSYVFP